MTLDDAAYIVDDAVLIELYKHQFDALVSFCAAIGEHNFRRSRVVALLNKADDESILKAAREIGEYGGAVRRKSKTYRNQRKNEQKLFLKPIPVAIGGKHVKGSEKF